MSRPSNQTTQRRGRPLRDAPVMISVATAFPERSFTQAEMRELLGVQNPVVQKLLAAPHIHTRRLMLLDGHRAADDDANNTSKSGNVDSAEAMIPTTLSLQSGSSLLTTKKTDDTPRLDGTPRQHHAAIGRETQLTLNQRFQRGLQTIGVDAARSALQRAGVQAGDISYVVAVTSTGLALPGFSAILIRELNLPANVHRADLVGMGCNAGMTGLKQLSMLLSADPYSYGLLVCCEICSALYVNDETVGSGIVNSLFGDGAVGVVMRGKECSAVAETHSAETVDHPVDCRGVPDSDNDDDNESTQRTAAATTFMTPIQDSTPSPDIRSTSPLSLMSPSRMPHGAIVGTTAVSPLRSAPSTAPATPLHALPAPLQCNVQKTQRRQENVTPLTSPHVSMLDFESATLPEFFDDMLYDVPVEHDRLCFRLSKKIPFVVGDNVHVPVLQLLQRHGLTPRDIQHWVVHTGGAAVIAGIQRNLNLDAKALRHTVSVLRDYGNISSGSFLASFERLAMEQEACSAMRKKAEVGDVTGTTTTTANSGEGEADVVKVGDRIVFIAMGPGTTIEVGLGLVQHV